MSSRIRPEEFTVHKYPDLIAKVNQLIIDIKIHHLIEYNPDLEKQRNELYITNMHTHISTPQWDSVVNLLTEIRAVLEKEKEHPRKYY